MTTTTDPIADAFSRYRNGDIAGALAGIEAVLASGLSDHRLSAFAGLLACQMGDPVSGIPHLERALTQDPTDLSTRLNLATALIAVGDFARVVTLCAWGGDDLKLRRLAAYAQQQLGDADAAIAGYRAVLAVVDSDFESWNNLANLLAAKGEMDETIEAFEQAISLRGDIGVTYVNYSKALSVWERHDDRQRVMRAAAQYAPGDAEVQLELGLAESAGQDFAAAEAAYRSAIALTPGFTSAWVELGMMLENLNRVHDLAALVADAEGRGFSADQIGFVRAWALRRQGRLDEALPAALSVSETIDPVRRNQLIGEIRDRLGDAPAAFAAFTAMNRAVSASPLAAKMQGGDYRAEVEATAARTTAERIAGWAPVTVDTVPPSPVFIVGFPRSGTTLTDTLLMNVPNLHVMEELPILRQVEIALGDPDRIDTLDSSEAEGLRKRYFEVLAQVSPPAPGQTVVDKFPLHMARAPLIHRVFPDAKIVFVERHPCDVVLSCFISNFQPNRATVHFLDLNDAARLYDAVLGAWTQAETLLPLNVHHIRYERMVGDLESEMRPLLDFLDIPWDSSVLDNRGAAAKREHIRTASYSQVTEPIYSRASGRWTRYRDQMAEVLPLLAPWAERMGYPM
jgi:tetratricopeptide (TPR) repeat protein